MDEFVCDGMLKDVFMSVDKTDKKQIEIHNTMLKNRLCI